MQSRIAFAGIAIFALAGGPQSVLAQTTDATTPAAPPVSREERKAETAAANKAGQLTPAGQGPMAPTPSKKSTMTREQRKAQARADEKAGNMIPAGEGPVAPTPTGKSTMTREQRKAQARADEKAGKMIPAGEGPGAGPSK
jgi:hypothetical protein